MSNYFEYNNKVAFHPGYYIKEIIDDSGYNQKEYAIRLNTTAKNLSCLINGEQSISFDMADKLYRVTGIEVNTWFNLQNTYDASVKEYQEIEEYEKEKKILKNIDYKYFKDNCNLVDTKDTQTKIAELRKLFSISSLNMLSNPQLLVSFRTDKHDIESINIEKANAMIQLAINDTIKKDLPDFNKSKFERSVRKIFDNYAVYPNVDEVLPEIKNIFESNGVNLVLLPNIKGSKVNGATKKINHHIMILITDRKMNLDTFWFNLAHEVSHVVNGDYSCSVDLNHELDADLQAEEYLIPNNEYQDFLAKNDLSINSIVKFSNEINRHPSIVVGRLQYENRIAYSDKEANSLKVQIKPFI